MASADKDRLMADLSAYLDGELSPERARQVEQFVAESEEARRTLADLQAISKALGDLPRMSAPASLPGDVRRSAERQVLLQERSPARKVRVLQLFARISASAALIAVCAFVGWTVLQRATPEVPSEAKREIASGRGGAVEDEARGTFAKGAPTDEPAQPPTERTAVGESAPEAPAIAMADKLEARERYEIPARSGRLAGPASKELVRRRGGVPAEEGERLAAKDQARPAEAGVPAAGPTAVMDVTPEVNVVVRPRDINEYNASLQTVALWQQPPPAVAGEPVVGRAARRAGGVSGRISPTDTAARLEYGFGVPTQQDFTLEVPADQVGDVLLALEQKAPQQVRVEMRFNVSDYARVQQMVMSADAVAPVTELQFATEHAPPPESSEALTRADTPRQGGGPAPPGADTFEAGRFAAPQGGRGRVVRTPSRSETTEPAEVEETKEDQRAAAYRLREARDAEALPQSKTLGYVGDSAVAKEAEEAPARRAKKGWDEQRQPRVEDVAAGVPARLALPSPEDKLEAAGQGPVDAEAESARPLPSAALQIRDHAIEIHERLGEMYRIMLGFGSDLDVPEKQPESAAPPVPALPVTLRVTLLPPPPAATQPGAQPERHGPEPHKP